LSRFWFLEFFRLVFSFYGVASAQWLRWQIVLVSVGELVKNADQIILNDKKRKKLRYKKASASNNAKKGRNFYIQQRDCYRS
jgi:hypothetical protein